MLILGWYSGLNEANLKQNRCRTQIAARCGLLKARKAVQLVQDV
jgi:hypothetical protein